MTGERSRRSLYDIEFRRPVENKKLCEFSLKLNKTEKTVLEVGSCGTWNQEMDYSRIVKWNDDEDGILNDEPLDEIPSLECEDSD